MPGYHMWYCLTWSKVAWFINDAWLVHMQKQQKWCCSHIRLPILCTSGEIKKPSIDGKSQPKHPVCQVFKSNCKMFIADVKQTDKLCFSVKTFSCCIDHAFCCAISCISNSNLIQHSEILAKGAVTLDCHHEKSISVNIDRNRIWHHTLSFVPPIYHTALQHVITFTTVNISEKHLKNVSMLKYTTCSCMLQYHKPGNLSF